MRDYKLLVLDSILLCGQGERTSRTSAGFLEARIAASARAFDDEPPTYHICFNKYGSKVQAFHSNKIKRPTFGKSIYFGQGERT